MTQATDTIRSTAAPHFRIVGVVSAAHFVSHLYILMLPPLFPFVRETYGVSYTQLGLAIAAFNVVSAALQTPAGFLVDWLGARRLLICGMVIGSIAFILAGLVNSFWFMVAMFALAGVGNTVYHPANYALLSQHVPARSIGQAFSFHTFAGMLGSSAAPAGLLILQNIWGWRGAFIGASALGLLVAFVMLLMRDQPAVAQPASHKPDNKSPVGWQLLLSTPIVLNLLFFFVTALMSGGIFNYSVVALGALYGTPVATANAALTTLLLLSAFGVLAGGVVASRGTRHGLMAAMGLVIMGASAALIGKVDLNTWLLFATMIMFGFFFGFISPSRDMIVREVTPPGSFGKVFGFVSTGFNIGGIVAPMLFGALMDAGHPQLVFFTVAGLGLLGILTVTTLPKRSAAV